ncbi:MAG: elongation factor Ts [Angelakisella sp.]|jgi:elongation factor Ts|nr:elongation factor Ts [Angelakisella sp.]MCI9528517.1 elongation factor Ts [Angelakisella sp.]
MAFTTKDVMKLRESTGCGMMDCKKALTETDGDMEKAIELLREKGLSKIAKKASRIAAEGLVCAIQDKEKKVGVVIEVNSETDFVAKNAVFVQFVEDCAKTVLNENPADVDALLACTIAGGTGTVQEALQEKILTIGENLKIRRFARYEGTVETYVHGGGRIGVMVRFEVEGTPDTEKFLSYSKDIAMQVAASSPTYLDKDAVPADTIAKEKEILTAQAINEGKPANIAEKMVMGRIGKYYKEVCLLEQPYIKDGDISVQKFTEATGKELGVQIKVVEFVRFEKGEGLEKREDNFADEVASMIK